MANKPILNHFLKESAKKLKQPQKTNLARNIYRRAIVFDYNLFNKTIYTKSCCVLSFVANKRSLNHFMPEST